VVTRQPCRRSSSTRARRLHRRPLKTYSSGCAPRFATATSVDLHPAARRGAGHRRANSGPSPKGRESSRSRRSPRRVPDPR
jgi:hypothetical protein